jgi:hypothetical protein
MSNDARDFKKHYDNRNIKPYGQVFAYHEGMLFKSGNNQYKLIASYESIVMLKDCTFERPTGDSVETKYQGRFMEWTGNTYADSSPYDINQAGERSVVFRLQLTINDENNQPIDDADVFIYQHDKKEILHFITNDDGMMHAIHNLKGAMLTQRSYHTPTSFEDWSTALEPHIIKIIKDGYEPYFLTKHMDQDKSETITLIPLSNASNDDDNIIQGESRVI